MVSVSIFALRDVIRQVQLNFQTPYNGKSHTSPSINADIAIVTAYLEEQQIQTYTPTRLNNEFATPVRDLMAEGAAYANTANPFRNFRQDTRKARYVNTCTPAATEPTPTPADTVDDECDSDGGDFGDDMELDLGDLALDEEEFPPDIDPEDFVELITDAIRAL